MKKKLLTITGLVMLFAACSRQYVDKTKGFQTFQIVGVGKKTGSATNDNGYSPERSELIKLLDSKIAAYQDLSKQLFETGLPNKRTVSEQLNSADQYRPLIDLLLRQTKVVSISATPTGGFETCVSLDITQDFMACLVGPVYDLANCQKQLSTSNYIESAESSQSKPAGSCDGEFCYPYPIVDGYFR